MCQAAAVAATASFDINARFWLYSLLLQRCQHLGMKGTVRETCSQGMRQCGQEAVTNGGQGTKHP